MASRMAGVDGKEAFAIRQTVAVVGEADMILPTALSHFRDKLSFETDAWDLKEMLRNGENVVVVDARSEAAYLDEHIPGAINFPHRLMTHDSTCHLDRTALYATYCDGIGCNASTKGALKLTELGFQVKELIGGIDWWRRDGYSTERSIVDLVEPPK